jgi:uncharacterized protein with FMN-binding domain
MMKKSIILIAVTGIFVIYSLGIRHQVPVIKKPALIASNKSSADMSNRSATNSNNGPITSSNSSSGSSTSSSGSNNSSKYKDGTYTGSVADAYYGNVQIQVIITSGKITKVKFLQYPNTHSTSVIINNQAMPYLQQETIQAQSSNVQLISGATYTSQAFVQSLQSALSQA